MVKFCHLQKRIFFTKYGGNCRMKMIQMFSSKKCKIKYVKRLLMTGYSAYVRSIRNIFQHFDNCILDSINIQMYFIDFGQARFQ